MHKCLFAVPFLFCAMTQCGPGGGGTPPEPSGFSFEVFVVGDSWAELSQGSAVLYSTDNMVASRMRGLGHEVVAEHRFGFGGTSAAQWVLEDPCATPGAPCGNPNVYAELIAALEAAEAVPLVYLSIGGNDIRVDGSEVDYRDENARTSAMARYDNEIRTLVAALLAVREDLVVVLPGYANFHLGGRSDLENITCQSYFEQFLSASADVDEPLVNALFARGDDAAGLADTFAALDDDDPRVFYTDLSLHFANGDAPTDPSRTGVMIDCLHLKPAQQRNFVVAVIDGFDARWDGL